MFYHSLAIHTVEIFYNLINFKKSLDLKNFGLHAGFELTL